MKYPGKLYCLDFETYYDSDYSLRKMPSFEYVADPRFKVHILQVLDEDGNELVLAPEEIKPWLEKTKLENHTMVGHNLYFDGMILALHYGVIPGMYIDTKGMANLLYRPLLKSSSLDVVAKHLLGRGKVEGTLASVAGVRELSPEQFEALAEYGIEDVRLTMEILQLLMEEFPEDEYPIMDAHLRLYMRRRMRIDDALARRLLAEREEQKRQVAKQITDRWGDLLPDDLTVWQALRRNPVVASIITHEGKLPPRKRSPKTNKLEYAFAKDDLAFQAFRADERLALLVEAKAMANSSILESRLKRLLRMHELYDGWAHPLLNYCGAHTGRSSGGDKLNFQNFPKKPEEFRHIFIPLEKHKVVIADSGQIEARVLAYLAGQEDLLEAFRENDRLLAAGKDPKKLGKDVYTVMARKIGAGDNRDLGKATVLGCIAEGQRVLTDAGWVPIEKVTSRHRVWDGAEFVAHDGVVFQGNKETIYYDGLRATPDHIVWTEGGRKVPFGAAASSMERRLCPPIPGGAHRELDRSGQQVRPAGREAERVETDRKVARTYDILNCGPRHRFVCEGWLVYNCGFGMAETKFVLTSRAAGNTAAEEDLRQAHAGWRNANPMIVRFWEEYAGHFQEAALSRRDMDFGPLRFETHDQRFFVILPSGRPLVYGRVRTSYNGLTDEMGRNLWYGLLVENLVQAYARDVVFQQVLAVPELVEYLWLLVHDEADLTAPETDAGKVLELALEALSTPRPWAPDLPTVGEGTVADTLIKA